MMGQHGFISWADDDKECYTRHARLHRKGRRLSSRRNTQAKGGDATAFGGAKYQTLARPAKRNAAFAAILPWLRGQVSQQTRFIGTVQDDEKILRFVNSNDAPRLAELGTSCPDHFLRTKIKPLYVDWNPQTDDVAALKSKLADGLEQYREDYAAYYDEVQTRQLARDARPESDGHAHPRPRHDRVGQGQVRDRASPPSSTTAPSK